MLFTSLLSISGLLAFASVVVAAAAASLPPTAIALLEQRSDLTIITSLVKRDPFLTHLYSTVTNVTILAAVDAGFEGFSDITVGPLNDRGLVRNILQYIILEGEYPTSAITTTATYAPTKLTNTSYVNVSSGKQSIRLVEEQGGGKKTVATGQGSVVDIKDGVCSLIPSYLPTCSILPCP